MICFLSILNLPSPVLAAGSTEPLSSWKVRSFDIEVNEMTFDARRDVLLATISSRSIWDGSMLVELNPDTGLPEGRRVYVLSEPGPIGVSDDGSTAFVGSYETNEIVRVDLGTFTVTDRFVIPLEENKGPLFSDSLAVQPGRTDTVVVVTRDLPAVGAIHGTSRLQAFRDGVALPKHIPNGTESVAFLDAERLARGVSGFGLAAPMDFLRLDDSGITVNPAIPTVPQAGSFEVSGGRVYTTTGRVIDAASGAVISRYSQQLMDALEVTPENNRLMTLRGGTASLYDLSSMALVDSGNLLSAGDLVATSSGYAVRNAVVGPGITAGNSFRPTGPGTPPKAITAGIRRLRVGANDLVYDDLRDKLYASVPATDRGYTNELVVINPKSGLVYERLALTGDPGPMAITSDRSKLYVGLNETGEVKQINLESLTVESSIQTNGGASPSPNWDLEAVPGSTGSIAVTGGSANEVAVFRGGAKLPKVVQDGPKQITFGNETTLYGANASLYTMQVDELGVSTTKVLPNVMKSFNGNKDADQIKVFDGMLYTSTGAFIDPVTGDRKAYYGGKGKIAGTLNEYKSASAVAPSRGVFYTADGRNLTEYNLAEQRTVGTWPITMGFTHRLVDTGTGVAAASPSGIVISGNGPRIATWGWHGFGQLGGGRFTTDRTRPKVLGESDVDLISAGLVHGVESYRDGGAKAWGSGAFGTNAYVWSRTDLPSGTTVRMDPYNSRVYEISSGMLHTLALDGGGLWAWGWNASGQLGDGTTKDTPLAVSPRFTTGAVVTGVAAGGMHSMAVLSDGTVQTWGSNVLGQLGDGTTVDSVRPKPVPGLKDVVAVSAGTYHSLALHSDGTVSAWGWNALGQLGDGSTLDRLTPVKVANLSGMKSISAGLAHNLSMGMDGEIKAWGWNIFGQLGDGTTIDRRTPITVAGVQKGFDTFSAGAFHNLAIRDGVTYAWGWNGFGQLGDGTRTDRYAPKVVTTVPNAYMVAAGGYHSMVARVTNSTLGGNYFEPGVWNP